MNKEQVLTALKEVREKSKPRKFQQAVDLTINFKGLDFKKPESAFNIEVALPNPVAQKALPSALVFVRDKNFAVQIKEKVSKVIMEDEIEKLKKKEVEKLMADYDVFLAEGPVMLTVGKFLGQILAPRGRMPKPITTNVAALEKVLSAAQTNIKVTNKKQKTLPLVHVKIGTEKFEDSALAENILAVYNAVEEKLPAKKQNVKSVYVKFSMGLPVKIGGKA